MIQEEQRKFSTSAGLLTLVDMDEAYSPQEVADKLGISRVSVLRMLRSGRLKGIRIGWRTWRVTNESLDAFANGEAPKKRSKKRKE